jgi:tRNA (guanine-N7-)-methyltransferase
MAKNKRFKYERVKNLPNVIFSKFGKADPQHSYPWYQDRFSGMERILELGCGKGEYSLAFAGADPHKLCVGIDSKSHRICVGAEKALAQGLENVLFFRVGIERIQEFFVQHSIHEIWLTFPDPHLKTRTVKSRLTGPGFLDRYAQILVPGGMVHLKTDNEVFYSFTRESVLKWGGRILAASEDIHDGIDCGLPARDIVSTFERKARSKDVTIKHLAFTLN